VTDAVVRRSVPAQAIGLLAWLLLAFAAAALGAAASADAGPFYEQLARPAWAPPAAVFAPVWAVLYVMMGTAAWLVWREEAGRDSTAALVLFMLQLCANAAWSWLFFAWRHGDYAFGEVLVLLALVALTSLAFARISRVAGLLMLPYLLWVAFASALTWAVWQANPNMF
jgi:benzodiazapine receptor